MPGEGASGVRLFLPLPQSISQDWLGKEKLATSLEHVFLPLSSRQSLPQDHRKQFTGPAELPTLPDDGQDSAPHQVDQVWR